VLVLAGLGWAALGAVRCSCSGVAASVSDVRYSCCHGWGSQTALPDALHSKPCRGLSPPTAGTGKSGFT